MLSKEENELLTTTGPDTPMGRMMRRFWIPICTSAQLPAPDCDPLRLSLLGESFVAFRDTNGDVGVLQELCMHRGVSLALGRVEHGGIRCLYHGWKFATDGKILDTPNNTNPRFRERLCAPAYPVREAGGLVWTYIGPSGTEPPFPHYEFFDGPDENRGVMRYNTQANYLQRFEGGVDSSHVGILHSNAANPAWLDEQFVAKEADFDAVGLTASDNAPTLEIEDTPFGYYYAAKRQVGSEQVDAGGFSVRVYPVMLPFGRIIPASAFQMFVFEVPQTDTSSSTYLIAHGPDAVDRDNLIRMMGMADERFWNDTDCDFHASWSDGLGQDRSRMDESWTGFDGISQEDCIMSLSMGPILDRTKEHMVAADRAVIHLRARLLESVRRHEEGGEPIGLDASSLVSVRSVADTSITKDDRWQDLLTDDAEAATTA